MARRTVKQLDYLPSGTNIKKVSEVPPGKILAHNPVVARPVQGDSGFRFWWAEDETDDDGKPHYVPCDCGWAAHLGVHYIARGWEESWAAHKKESGAATQQTDDALAEYLTEAEIRWLIQQYGDKELTYLLTIDFAGALFDRDVLMRRDYAVAQLKEQARWEAERAQHAKAEELTRAANEIESSAVTNLPSWRK
jgi:hypothetical protein